MDRVVHTVCVVVCFLSRPSSNKACLNKYYSKNSGHHDFQIDLGVALLNYGIDLDWDGESKKPDCMRQVAPVPCDCKQCYFCLNGTTKGISHRKEDKAVIVHKCNKRIRISGCYEDLVIISTSGGYFQLCYKQQLGHLKTKVKKNHSNESILGCPQCKVCICKSCWDDYMHDL